MFQKLVEVERGGGVAWIEFGADRIVEVHCIYLGTRR